MCTARVAVTRPSSTATTSIPSTTGTGTPAMTTTTTSTATRTDPSRSVEPPHLPGGAAPSWSAGSSPSTRAYPTAGRPVESAMSAGRSRPREHGDAPERGLPVSVVGEPTRGEARTRPEARGPGPARAGEGWPERSRPTAEADPPQADPEEEPAALPGQPVTLVEGSTFAV